MEKGQIVAIIFNAIDELNNQLSSEEQVAKSEDTVLFGKSATIDSLGFINLIVEVEDELEEECETRIVIANENAMSLESSPFRTVASLADYIIELLEENTD